MKRIKQKRLERKDKLIEKEVIVEKQIVVHEQAVLAAIENISTKFDEHIRAIMQAQEKAKVINSLIEHLKSL